jgi:hypothetical protein
MLKLRAANFGGEAASSVDDSLDAREDTRAVAVMGGTAGVAKTGDGSRIAITIRLRAPTR